MRGVGAAVVALVLAQGACGPPPPCGAAPAPPGLAAAQTPAGVDELLGETARLARAAGASELTVIASALGTEGDRAGAFLTTTKDKCLVVIARGSKGIGDVDLFVFQDDGSTLVADESSSDQAAVVVCPTTGERVYVSARVASGGGVFAVGAHEVAPERVVAVARAVGARALGEESGRLESWPGLEPKVVARRRALGSTWEDVRRFAAPVDPRAPTRTTVTIEARRCLDVLVVPSDDVASLEVVAETEDGRIAARAQGDGRDRVMVLCSELGEVVTIAARPRASAGMAAFVIGRSPVGAAPEIARSQTIDRVAQVLPVEGARAALAKELDLSWGKAKEVGQGTAKVGSRATLPVKLAEGCSRLDVIAGAPLGPVTAALWDDAGRLLAEATGALRATLYACGKARDVRLDVESRGRVGPFGVDLRLWAEKLPELLRAPAAAARLLDRVVGAEGTAPAGVEAARGVDLAADTLHTSSFIVAPSSCSEVVVTLDAGGSGVDLRLIDEASGDDVIGRGRTSASQRICAGNTPRRARVEISVDSGPAKALVLIRTER